MAARRYEISLRVLKNISRVSAANCKLRILFFFALIYGRILKSTGKNSTRNLQYGYSTWLVRSMYTPLNELFYPRETEAMLSSFQLNDRVSTLSRVSVLARFSAKRVH